MEEGGANGSAKAVGVGGVLFSLLYHHSSIL